MRMIEYTIKQKDGIAVMQKLIEALQVSDIDEQYMRSVLLNYCQNEIRADNILIRVSTGSSDNHRDWLYRVLPTALDRYYEYIELQESRQASVDAKKQAMWATIIAIAALIISGAQLFVELWKK